MTTRLRLKPRSKSLRNQVTEKLFYNQYAYKLVCRNDLSNEFRNNRLHHVRKLLDALQLSYESGQRLEIIRYKPIGISQDSFEDAKVLYNELKNNNDYRLRIQYKELVVYSKDRDWLHNLGNKLRQSLEWWEPQDTLTPLQPGYAYLKRPIDYDYRVYTKDRLSHDARNWLLNNNNNKVKLGPVMLEYLQEGADIRLNDLYFYAKSDRVLTVLRLLMGNNIRSINKVVCLTKNA